ncbi:MAG: valine--tRNA ligase [Candidatus Saccharibacteria bacterium]|nr:valine--tRNA ligase [Candidatus Saccharibacteria bacterium]
MAKEKFVKAYEPGEFEAEIYQAWEQAGTFQPDKRETERGTFSLVMPPPNANGNLHIGHGLTIATEDAMARYHRMRGEATWYVPGADHAGFETWVVYERELEKHGKTRFQYSRDELYANVWDFVQEQRGNMELQLRALGASCAWNDLTFTLDENVVRRTYKTFEKMWKDGMVYRGEKLVNYCPKHQTAFADIEVEYKEDSGHLWDIAYPIPGKHPSASSADALLAGRAESPAHSGAPASSHLDASLESDGDERNSENVEELTEIIVSTTRPETLFGDTAVAVNPEDKRYKGMKGQKVVLPLTGRTIPVIYDEHADPEYGTGAVKITPAHDYDDFQVGERHDLARIRVIDDEGRMINCGEEYDGLTTEECRKKVLKELKKAGLLRGEKKIKHAVGHCYKCGAVIEPTLKEQWFIDTSKLAAGAIEHIENDEIKFFPAQKKKVLIDYLRGLKDWNISRQIPWGIAIPMFRRADLVLGAPTEVDLDDDGSSDVSSAAISVSGEVAPEWVFDTRVNLTEIEVNGVKYIRDEDTFDTWFSSSHWPIVCTDWEEPAQKQSSSSNKAHSLQNQELISRKNPFYPLDVMETGADILFAWVARMIMMGVYVTGEVPFRNVYLHGLVLDEHGQKMSKSKGNVINPMDLVAKYGSDAFRMGILRGRGAGMNQAFSEESVKAGRNTCNKIWNIGRLIQKIVDENFETQEVATVNMGEDWICREITEALVEIEKQMKQFRFAEAVETVQSLVWDKYADWFLESQKIYKNSSLLKVTFEAILKILHPFAPFVTEAIWQNLSWTDGMIITASWPEFMKYDPISAENFEKIIEVVTAIRQVQAELPGGFTKARKYGVIIGDDSLVDDNSLLVAQLAHVDSIRNAEGAPSGLRLPVANREIYLDVPPEVVEEYREKLDEKILAVGAELDGLNARMMNPRYVDRAPAELVEETRRGIEEKERLIERLKTERSAI